MRVHGSGHQYHHRFIGGMFRLAAVQAAVLSVKLPHLETWHAARRKNAALYDQLLAGSKIVTPHIDEGNWSIYNQYIIRVPDRDRVKQYLQEKGVGSAIYYPIPLHLQECFSYLNYHPGDFPESERACREVLALPIYPELPEEQLRYAAQQLLAAAG
jgi:dTDP-4-amino-4,6-dideoxygalactose transaminase